MRVVGVDGYRRAVRVVGVDGYRGGWVAVVLEGGRYADARVAPTFRAVLDAEPQAAVVGVDMPIGLPACGFRPADRAARARVGRRWPSVFLTPPLEVFESSGYAEADARCRALTTCGISAQAYALRHKVIEVAGALDGRVHEVHPEVSFAALQGVPLALPKRTAGGAMVRLRLLEAAGIVLPADLGPAAPIPLDDVLDAAVVAWSARRIAAGEAGRLPPAGESHDPERDGGVIWF